MPLTLRVNVVDHPRLRGEQQSRDLSVPQIRGSPPLARGTARILRKLYGPRGITPACAGNSGIYGVFYGDFWDHPRLRGEQPAAEKLFRWLRGSPPLARGTVVRVHFLRIIAGITPACAGNSPFLRGAKRPAWDHPRLRGEQSVLTRGKTPRVGSPPLARGTVYRTSPPRARGGITPACAGNRHTEDKAYHGIGDHPRLRGEQCHSISAAAFRAGSPPLARGTVDTRGARGA